jgi:hypothetical protein
MNEKKLQEWIEIIDFPSQFVDCPIHQKIEMLNELVKRLAFGFHKRYVTNRKLTDHDLTVNKRFEDLSETEQTSNFNLALSIPEKFKKINVRLRPYKTHCQVVIITDNEIEEMAKIEHERWREDLVGQGWRYGIKKNKEYKTHPCIIPFEQLPENKQKYDKEIIYSIPVLLKAEGFELYRDDFHEKFSEETVKELAAKIHSTYVSTVINNDKNLKLKILYRDVIPSFDLNDYVATSYDELNDDYKSANQNSAAHIITKLKAAGYNKRPLIPGKEMQQILFSQEEIDMMARIEHARWCWERRLSGWTYYYKKIEKRKRHNLLIPYDKLTQENKDKNIDSIKKIPELMESVGYEIYKGNL